ncbi:uncharacterized protein PV06_02524 [Exophiala oligosperma]|uniref:Seipin n=1 Tax=Exophiala oligosperma TaxID=215243 RepID=A0A0D2DUX6_9EURO|nr:uncharacterized protein PV06_02524 [Exophiala oligosperma]KIW46903.1 hypothetical protein PV06_02524 [Exophiala oligosperma]
MADLVAFNDDGERDDSIFRRAWYLALTPARVLTSRTAVKAYLGTLLFLTTSTVLLTVSSTAFGFFYYNYIPQIDLERVLYLQYGEGPRHPPHATIALDTTALITQQAYDVDLILDMPRTPTNLDAGNFMLDLSLLGPGPNVVRNVPEPLSSWLGNITVDNVYSRSRRPTILPYSSPILSVSNTLLYLPWHMLGLRDLDAAHLVVPMFEMITFPRGARNIPTHARLELQSTSVLQVYSAKLVFRAKFQGMRYLIYNYRVPAFVVFTALFYTVSVTSMGLAWALLSMLWSKKDDGDGRDRTVMKKEGRQSDIKREDEGRRKIKEEEETDSSQHGLSLSNLSDTAAQFPTRTGQMPLRFEGRSPAADAEQDEEVERLTPPPGPDEVADDEEEEDETQEIRGRRFEGDSGIGTSMESEHQSSGIVRRRSSRGLSNR